HFFLSILVPTPELYTLSLHDALPIYSNWLIAKAIVERVSGQPYAALVDRLLVRPLGLKDSGIYHGDSGAVRGMAQGYAGLLPERSEEHTSELQSRRDLVCRLLLEKKK